MKAVEMALKTFQAGLKTLEAVWQRLEVGF